MVVNSPYLYSGGYWGGGWGGRRSSWFLGTSWGFGPPLYNWYGVPRTRWTYLSWTWGVPYCDYRCCTPSYYAYYYGSTATAPPVIVEESTSSSDVAGDRFLAEARGAFLAADYREVVRLAGHAAIESPQAGEPHFLLFLALFMLEDYQSAAVEAHALANAEMPTWENIASYYGHPDDFTAALRQLETFVGEHPDSDYGTFLLGFQYLSLGHQAEAADWLSKAATLAPDDEVLARLLEQAGPPAESLPSPAETGPELPSPTGPARQ